MGILCFYWGCNTKIKGIEGEKNKENQVIIGQNVQVENITINPSPIYIGYGFDTTSTWEQSKADTLIYFLLDQYCDQLDSTRGGCYEFDETDLTIHYFDVEIQAKELKIGLVESRFLPANGLGCPYSLFEFIKEKRGWVLKKKKLHAFEAGRYGWPADSVNLVMIGHEKYAIITRDRGGTQGTTAEYVGLYTFYEKNVKCVFGEIISFDNTGNGESAIVSFTGNLRIINEGTGYYDIITTKYDKHIYNQEQLEELYPGFIPDTILFRFNGREYVKISP